MARTTKDGNLAASPGKYRVYIVDEIAGEQDVGYVEFDSLEEAIAAFDKDPIYDDKGQKVAGP